MKKIFAIALLIIAPLLCIMISLLVGIYSLSPGQVSEAVFSPGAISTTEAVVVLRLRLPRALAAAFCGAALAASGAAFQGVFRNPLVNSGILGVSNGAGLGA